jgi:Skp family chaperone for outer membrane proteins
MGKEEAENAEKMGALLLAAEKLQQRLRQSARRGSEQQRLMDERADADAQYQLKMQAFQREEAALDKNAKDYQLKLKALQDKESQLRRQHQNDVTAITVRAEEERNRRILSADSQFNNAIAQGLTQSIMGHESWAKMVSSLGDQVVSGMLQNAIKSILADDMTKERDAAAAARKAFNIGMNMGPAGIVLGPVFAAAAFTAVMAFQGGTDAVPGVGNGDIVPAMLEPGEGVVPKGVMEGLNNVARNGGFNGGGQTTHVHVRPTYHVQTIDGSGMQAALEKHTDVLQRHFENAVRKMNR